MSNILENYELDKGIILNAKLGTSTIEITLNFDVLNQNIGKDAADIAMEKIVGRIKSELLQKDYTLPKNGMGIVQDFEITHADDRIHNASISFLPPDCNDRPGFAVLIEKDIIEAVEVAMREYHQEVMGSARKRGSELFDAISDMLGSYPLNDAQRKTLTGEIMALVKRELNR